MIIIAHRAKLFGSGDIENNPSQIDKIIDMGFGVEIDLHVIGNRLYLGHDGPEIEVDGNWLRDIGYFKGVIFHAKNHEAVNYLLNTPYHWFWHQEDDLTLTSKNIAWCYPGLGKSITPSKKVFLDFNEPTHDIQISDYWGFCTDYPVLLKEILESQ